MTNATIAEQVNAMRAGRPIRLAGEAPNAFEADQVRLAERGVPDGILASGSVLPDVTLVDPDGLPTSLYAALGTAPAVVVFYRGGWCPYCNIALKTYEAELLPRLRKRGVALIAISPQRPDDSLSTKEKDELSFTVLSDPGNTLARQVGIVMTPSAASLEAQRERGLDLTERNADGTAELPMPTTLVLDAIHVVTWVDVHPDYTTRSEPEDILAALDRS